MNRKISTIIPIVAAAVMILFLQSNLMAGTRKEDPALDAKVRKFLDTHARQWHDLNIPEIDGKTLYGLIIKNNYRSALEIGTSTGHSGIWLAWALSKTGGKLITVEIDGSRYRKAIANFKEAGLSEYIDARLGDAHQIIPELPGPFDFVFSDADKEWYKNYFVSLSPKLVTGGCFAAHNVREPRGRHSLWGEGTESGTQEFLSYVKSLSNYETTVNHSGAGLSISYKRGRR